MDLMDVSVIDIYKYGLKLLSILSSDDEIKEGAVEPTATNKYGAIEQMGINHIKS
jgi:hypothetical protein